MTNLSNLLENSNTPEKRRNVVEYIQAHPGELEEILDTLFSDDGDIRYRILDLVDLMSPSLNVKVMEKAIANQDVHIKVKGLQAAYRTRTDLLNDKVEQILKHTKEEFEARKWALHILGSTDPDYYSKSIAHIARDLSEDIALRKEAIFALTKIVTDKTLGTICTLLGDANVEIRQSGAWALSNIGSPDSINCLLAALDDVDERVRDWAIRGLRDIDDARALQGLAIAIRNSLPEEQVRMIRLVIEKRSEVILRVIVELLDSSDISVRRTAAWALSVSPYPPAAPSLRMLLDDIDEQTRDYARIALIRCGGVDPSDLRLL